MTLRKLPQRQDEKKITWVELGETNLPLVEMELTVANAYFHRVTTVQAASENNPAAFRDVANGTIYRFPGMNRAQTVLPANGPQHRWLRLRIPDNDSPPLTVESVILRWPRQNLYFVPEPGRRYELRFGGTGVAAPVYDLAVLLPTEPSKLRGLTMWQLGEPRLNSLYRPLAEEQAGRWGTVAFYAVLLLLAAGVAFWLYRLARNLPPPNASPPTEQDRNEHDKA